MAISTPESHHADDLRDEVARAGGELTMSVNAVLELFSDGQIDSNSRRRARQELARQRLACEPDLVQAGPTGFVTIFAASPTPFATGARLPPAAERIAPEPTSAQAAPPQRRAPRLAALIASALALLAATGFLAWTLGESTRKSDAQVTSEVRRAVAARGERAASEQAAAVHAAKTAQKASDTKRARKHLKQVVAKTRKSSFDRGYAAGNSAGYSAGNSAGYSAGNAAGIEEGVDKASDELVCSDDSDVDLPPCFDW